jgi:cytochrome c5
MSYNAHDGADAGTGSQSGRGLKVAFFALLTPAVVLAWMVYYFVSHTAPAGALNAASMPSAVAQRIAKVGTVEVRDNSTKVQHTGEEVFKRTCTACHSTGALGSPKFGDAAAWAPRTATGYEALLHSALKGKNSMPAQGGGEYDDVEVGRAIVYMANAGGAKFAEPKAPAAAASAPVAAK